MDEKEKAKKILKILNKLYPTTPIPLDHTSNFTLLMSVLLSAQCTDLNVNNVTKNIYPKYNRPEHFVKLGRKKIEGKIVYFSRPMDPKLINTGKAYGGCVGQRWSGAMKAAKYGAVGVVLRSVTHAEDHFAHTGSMGYVDSIPKRLSVTVPISLQNLMQ